MKISIEIEDAADGFYRMRCIDENGETLCEDTGRPTDGIVENIREILAVKEAQESIAKMIAQNTFYTTFFRFPLTGCLKEYGSEDSQDGEDLIPYEPQIGSALKQRQDDMVQYYGEPYREYIRDILLSAEWGTAEYEGELCGIVAVKTSRQLADDETYEIGQWIGEQNADGIGEGFAQMPISIEPGVDLYLYFGCDNDVVPIYVNKKDGE